MDPHSPKASDEEWLDRRSGGSEGLQESDRLGKFDYTAVMENLPKAVLYSYIYSELRKTSDDAVSESK